VACTFERFGVRSDWAYSLDIRRRFAAMPLGSLKTLANEPEDNVAIAEAMRLIAALRDEK
jgi:hypothetical protein